MSDNGSGDGRIERKVGPPYQGYEIGATKPRILAMFVKRYGHVPDEIVKSGSIWLAGPVGGNDAAAVALGNQADSDGRRASEVAG
jgi:hypothetical protein